MSCDSRDCRFDSCQGAIDRFSGAAVGGWGCTSERFGSATRPSLLLGLNKCSTYKINFHLQNPSALVQSSEMPKGS